MTISSSPARWVYTATADQTVFAYTTEIQDDSWLKVYDDGALVSSGYSVSGVGQSSGGNVTFTTGRSSGAVISIEKVPPRTQTRPFPNTGDFDTSEVEDALDKLTMLVQDVDQNVTRSLRQPVEDATDINRLPAKASRASKYLAFDSDGHPIASSGPTGTSDVPVSAFGETLIDDDSAATARATLGVDAASAKGSDIASATTITIPDTGTYFDITGTTTITGMTVSAGRSFILQFDGAVQLTDSASLDVGGANITTAAGTRILFYATAADTVNLVSAWNEGSSPTAMTQAQAEAGTDTVPRMIAAVRLAQAIAAMVGVKVGTFTYDISTATGTKAVTGVGFSPRLLLLVAAKSPSASIGWIDGSAAGCIYNNSGGTTATWTSAAAGIHIEHASGADNSATLSSFDADGFTLTMTKTGSPTGTATYYYVAIG